VASRRPNYAKSAMHQSALKSGLKPDPGLGRWIKGMGAGAGGLGAMLGGPLGIALLAAGLIGPGIWETVDRSLMARKQIDLQKEMSRNQQRANAMLINSDVAERRANKESAIAEKSKDQAYAERMRGQQSNDLAMMLLAQALGGSLNEEMIHSQMTAPPMPSAGIPAMLP
jgi:hypothetical protein